MGSQGEWGSGAGKGGGAGGSIRESGGAFGKMEAAREEEYFRKLQSKQLKELNDLHQDEIGFLKEQIREHEKQIHRHKEKLNNLKKMQDNAKELD
ncbi:PREDICTED: ATPase inhibitor mai-2, mitochondrial-like isoform X2 [Priapulus caudatus]|nr:PREDICTED: ATPase inhibitor mai-2, mitochondrial-like isoform X2 [Priapulus caudatus]XP_014673666.1 PREDICTED: ATPase inhibitor mai-2, mitochondrial-like isoform X2 [Priapulus caudatus]